MEGKQWTSAPPLQTFENENDPSFSEDGEARSVVGVGVPRTQDSGARVRSLTHPSNMGPVVAGARVPTFPAPACPLAGPAIWPWCNFPHLAAYGGPGASLLAPGLSRSCKGSDQVRPPGTPTVHLAKLSRAARIEAKGD